MPKRRDESQIAFDTLQEIIERDAERNGTPRKPKPEPEKVPYRVKAGRKGGMEGGKARAKKLSASTRMAIAKKAALTRWKNKRR